MTLQRESTFQSCTRLIDHPESFMRHPQPKTASIPLRIVLTLCSASIWVAIFPQTDVWPLAWIGLLPFFFVLSRSTGKQAFGLGWLFGMVQTIGMTYWLYHAVHFHSSAGLFTGIAFSAAIWGFMGFYQAVFAVFASKIIKNKMPAIVKSMAVASLWVSLELIRTHFMSGNPWGLAGQSQAHWLPIIQVCDITGVYGVSFLILLSNYAIFESIRCGLNARRMAATLVLPLVLVSLALVYGRARLAHFGRENLHSPRPSQIMAVVQGSVDQSNRWRQENSDQIVARHVGMTAAAIENGARLVVWPETTVPYYLQDRIPEQMVRLLKKAHASLITGGPRYEFVQKQFSYYNSAFHLTTTGIADIQDKMHLLPFGEYFPLSFIDVLKLKFSGPREYIPGSELTVFNTPVGRAGVLICWEAIFPDLACEFTRQGIDVLIVISNDSWFGRTSAHYQHFIMSVFRAVECRRPVVRASNTGISGFVEATGSVSSQLPPFTEGFLLNELRTTDAVTFYCRYGDVFAFSCVLFLLALTVVQRRMASMTVPADANGQGNKVSRTGWSN